MASAGRRNEPYVVIYKYQNCALLVNVSLYRACVSWEARVNTLGCGDVKYHRIV